LDGGAEVVLEIHDPERIERINDLGRPAAYGLPASGGEGLELIFGPGMSLVRLPALDKARLDGGLSGMDDVGVGGGKLLPGCLDGGKRLGSAGGQRLESERRVVELSGAPVIVAVSILEVVDVYTVVSAAKGRPQQQRGADEEDGEEAAGQRLRQHGETMS
jgi:hypothetical protein